LVVRASLVVCIALAVSWIAIVTRDSSGSSSVAIRAGSDDAPAGWTRIEYPVQGLSIAIPQDWVDVPSPFSKVPVAFLVGTSDPGRVSAGEFHCQPDSRAAGTWVTVSEYRSESELATSRIVTEQPHLTVAPRPDFTTADRLPRYVSCEMSDGFMSHLYVMRYAFTDGGRFLLARIVTTEMPDSRDADVAHQVLDTMRVEQLDQTTSKTITLAPPTPTVTPVTTTIPEPTGPMSEDEVAIRNAFGSLVGQNPRDALEPYVEDFASIADSWREGMAQNSEEFMRRHASRADRVTITDDTHADVEWSLLLDGTSRFGTLPGGAIKIDGKWYITRDTVCNLLTYGGIICPPRS
jgi:hypothetical protein